jgi:hypothetical protein
MTMPKRTSNCEHLEVLVSRGPGKLQRLLWQILLDHGRPVTFAEIRGRAQVGDSRERRVRRALQAMMNHGFVIRQRWQGRSLPLFHEPTHSSRYRHG